MERNTSRKSILLNALMAAVSLFINGLGVYLTIHADIGAGPWDVLNVGLSKTLGILYGSASIMASMSILILDIIMREPIGLAMFIDAVVVGKSVDFFNYIDIVPVPKTLAGALIMMFVGLTIMGYTQCFYMRVGLGCGPRDTLVVGLARRVRKIPIGVVSIVILSLATGIGYLLGGPVGVGTLICAFCSGPIMQFAFRTVGFDATAVHHQNLRESFAVLFAKSGKCRQKP